jgi:hypothetical protein
VPSVPPSLVEGTVVLCPCFADGEYGSSVEDGALFII